MITFSVDISPAVVDRAQALLDAPSADFAGRRAADLVAQIDETIRAAQQLCAAAGKLNDTPPPVPAGLTELWQLREKLARI